MKLILTRGLLFILLCLLFSSWGFFGHKQINRHAVFILPPEMIGFYKHNISFITESAVNPDRRRYAVVDEAARHYIDLDHFGDSVLLQMPKYWDQAVLKYSEDTLKAHGILPWHINKTYYQLRDAFMLRDPAKILRISADLGHYIADAHVPLHTTKNYNGQLTGQEGIHGFWESRLPELYFNDYTLFVGKATYINNTQIAAWDAVEGSHKVVDSVLTEEKKLGIRFGEKKYSFETKGKQTIKVYSQEYAKEYHRIMDGMIERRLRCSIKMIGSFWYTAWIEAGQPDLKSLIAYTPSAEEMKVRHAELQLWKQQQVKAREHENAYEQVK